MLELLADLLAVRHHHLRVAPETARLIAEWPPALERVYSLPRCAKPGFRVEGYSVSGLPGARCGWRGPEGVNGVALGDSFTEGPGVSDKQTWPALAGLTNLGLGAQGLAGHLERLRASKLRPKTLVLQVCSNDLYEDEWVEKARAGTLKLPKPPAPKLFGRFLGHLWHAAVLRLRGRPAETEEQWRLFERNLKVLRDEVKGARFIVLAEPPAFARRLNERLPWVQAISVEVPRSERLFFDGHWDARGHARVAARVKEAL